MPRHSKPLSHKEQRFRDEYLVDGNATRAALVAGYSPHTAQRISSQMLQKPHIKAAIEEALKDQEKRTLVRADENLMAIEALAVKAEAEGNFPAAVRARELIGKHYGSFAERVELTGKNGGPIETKRSAAELSDDELAEIALRGNKK